MLELEVPTTLIVPPLAATVPELTSLGSVKTTSALGAVMLICDPMVTAPLPADVDEFVNVLVPPNEFPVTVNVTLFNVPSLGRNCGKSEAGNKLPLAPAL